MAKAAKKKTLTLREREDIQIKKMKDAKTFLEMVRAWGNDMPDIPPEELGKLSIFGKLMPQTWVDYGNMPHIHQMERRHLDAKTKCLAFISAYLMRTAPKIAPHWVINAKQLGATDEEILEAAIVAVEATAKAKMAEVDEVMTKLMNSPAYVNAKVYKK